MCIRDRSFTPHLIPVNTGICSTITAKVKKGADLECVGRLLEEAYAAAPFVRLLGRNQPADTKNCLLYTSDVYKRQDPDRWRFALQQMWSHRVNLRTDWRLKANINMLSAEYMLRDFYPEIYQRNSSPDNTAVSYTHL